MKRFFAGAALVSAAMYLGAEATLERPKDPSVVRIRWITDTNPARTAQLALFNRQNPRIQAYIDPNPTGDPSKLIVQCATGVGADVMDLDAPRMQAMAAAGVLLDLTPYAKKMGFSPDRTFPAIRGDLQVDGRQYSFPCNVSAGAVIYNRAVFDDHGVPYPKAGWTYPDFVKTCRAILDRPSKSGRKHMALANVGGLYFFLDLHAAKGGKLFSEDGLRSRLAEPAALSALREYRDMMHREKVIPTPTEISAMSSQGGFWSGTINLFSSGEAAMMVLGRFYCVQVPNFPALKGRLGTVTVPCEPGMPSRSICGARSAAVNVKSPHRREALEFLKFLAGREYSEAIVKDGDGLPPNPEVAASGQALVNSMVPDPAFHQAFVDAMRNAASLDYSPYLDTAELMRWLQEAVDKVENRMEEPEAALKRLAAQIDRQIRENIEREDGLRERLKRQR